MCNAVWIRVSGDTAPLFTAQRKLHTLCLQASHKIKVDWLDSSKPGA